MSRCKLDIAPVNIEPRDALTERYERECGPVVTKPLYEWFVPYSSNRSPVPTLTITRERMSINAAAMRAMGVPSYIRVGAASALKQIIIQPVEEKTPDAFSVRHFKKSISATIGGRKLLSRLAAAGFQQGKYLLEYDKAKDWWVAKAERK